MILLLVTIAIPTVLVIIAAGVLIRKLGHPDTAGQRLFLFVAWAGMGLLAVIFIVSWLMFPPPLSGLSVLLAPAACSINAMAFLQLHEFSTLRRKDKILIYLALALLVGLTVVLLGANIAKRSVPQFLNGSLVPGAILSGAVLVAGIWRLGRRYSALLGLGAFVGLALFNGWVVGVPLPVEPPPALPLWMAWLSAAIYLTLPGSIIAIAALLISIGLERIPLGGQRRLVSWWPVAGRLALAGVLLAYFVYTFAWTWIWDQSDDGMRAVAITSVSDLAAIAAGVVIGLTSIGWRRWAGVVFAGLVPVLMFGVLSGYDYGFIHHKITEARATRIQEAVAHFQAAHGRYPAELGELVPGELWWISPPVVLYGQGWCYQGGSDYYRLGAIYREDSSAPFSVRVYASAGTPTGMSWVCDAKLAEVKSQYDAPESLSTIPTPTPLPTSVVSIQRTTVQPILRAASMTVGSWSPSGEYLVFGLPELSGDQTLLDLQFLKAKTGEVCQANERKWVRGLRSDGLTEHFAWLPSGRLLYVSEAGEMAVFQPCMAGMEDLTGRYPMTFTRAVSYNEQNGRVLLKNQASYWILDGASLAARQIAGVTPNPNEFQSDRYAWSLGGDRLAITRVNGQEAKGGTTVYIAETVSGTVERSLPFNYGPDWPDPPFVDWLTHDELLVQGGGTVKVIDLRSDPPGVKDLIRDVFLLDAVYPNDFSSEDTVALPGEGGYFVGVRVNRPQNQAVYVYASKTGHVEVFHSEANLLLFLPGGNWMQLPKFESPPTYQDEYEMVWQDQSVETRLLKVEGHVPRSQPQLFPKYLPNRSQLIFSSLQGISLISIPGGETAKFWTLTGGGGSSSRLYPAPLGEGLVVAAQGDGLYYIPLLPGE
jgi:hypothetical protein